MKHKLNIQEALTQEFREKVHTVEMELSQAESERLKLRSTLNKQQNVVKIATTKKSIEFSFFCFRFSVQSFFYF